MRLKPVVYIEGKNERLSGATLALILLSFLCFIYTYQKTFLWLYERYTSPASYYSHGFLIPLISAYLIWRKKDQLLEAGRSSSGVGLSLIAMALVVHIFSVWTHIFFTSGFSILLLAVGLSLYLFGPEFSRKIAFPLGFLAFMFPLPLQAISALSLPLKLMVASIAADVVRALGVPLFREGAIIHLAKTSLAIGDPCTGIRSLISLLAVGALIAYFSKTTTLRRMILVLFAIPVAIFANTLRVCALILAANWFGGQWASPEHLFHLASGMTVFIISTILLLAAMRVLE